MARGKRQNRKVKIDFDSKYKSKVVRQFINIVMKAGKKTVAERIVYEAMEQLGSSNEKALEKYMQALENVRPAVGIRSRRVGGANYQVPVEVPAHRQVALAMRWILKAARARKAAGMSAKLYAELKDAAENRGGAVKKRDETLRMVESNKAFSHFRW